MSDTMLVHRKAMTEFVEAVYDIVNNEPRDCSSDTCAYCGEHGIRDHADDCPWWWLRRFCERLEATHEPS